MGLFKSLAPTLLGGAAGFAIGGPVGAGIGASAGGMVSSAFAQDDANKANVTLGREQMAFQRDMSNTAHQREVRDLQKAGLNPILSANAGASTPTGAMPQVEPVDYGKVATQGVTTGLQARQLKKDIDATDSQISVNDATKVTAKTQQNLNTNSALNMEQNRKNLAKTEQLLNAQIPAVKAESKMRKRQAELKEENAGAILLNEQMNTLSNSARNIGDSLKFWKGSSSDKGKVIRRGNTKTHSDGTKYDSVTGEILNESY